MKLPPKEVVKPKLYKRNKLVFGVGVNDADYNVVEYATVDGKRKTIWRCHFYQTWVNMLLRCYSEVEHRRKPTYKGCKVCDEWLIFSNFKRWMEQQDWEGKQLDKDLLVEGNKIYSPKTCIFVDHKINSFVCGNPFIDKQEYLGLFTNELDAHLAWKARKHELACQLADSEYCNDPRLTEALRRKYA